jgi:hypothetical protein
MVSQTATQYLDSLVAAYTPTFTQFDSARSHRATIEVRLDTYLGLREMFETGSLRHGTGVRWYSDADYIASLKGVRPGSELTALNKVKETLQGRFPSTQIVVRRPAVVCRFADGPVEIVPAYADVSSDGFWIPDPTGNWMKTYPKQHNTYVNDANKKHGGAAKQLARLAKIWKYKRSVPVSSCYLEMRAAKHADDVGTWIAPWDLHDYLKHLSDHGLVAMNDPTGLGSRFGATSSDSTRADALSKLNTAVGRAARAKAANSDGDHATAISCLKLLFDQ